MSTAPDWYKDAIFYEIRVRAFYDSDGDGIGDFRGLAQKLDYLRGLGVNTLWLLPFYPSPLKDDGYDISDYTSVHPDCGTLRDFKHFLNEAHKRGLRVVTELVLNHTSDQHPWFQRARKAKPGSKWRDFYVWSDDPDRYSEARIIFKDFEVSNWTWDREAHGYYWHRFYHNQPDLNFENPAVRKATLQAMEFWLDLGVDGLRLDAVPYLFEREGTNCENLPETHTFLKELRAHVDARYENRMLLAEANQWPEDAVAYFGDDDECHMAFHFPIMPRLFMALHMEDRFPVVDILEQTPAIPEHSQWALFLRNHDELTLEMVTDEERDYMYRVYADDRKARINLGIRRRLAPLLRNDRRRIELMNGLLFSLPGTPVLYYGDEIGMGDNIHLGDRHGVRTPMQWSSDRNAGFSRASAQQLYLPIVVDAEYHYETVNVETQEANPHSLLWWTRRLIALRKRFEAFGRGDIEFLHPRNRKVLAFMRHFGDQHILVVANLSRFVQYVELDLAEYKGRIGVELFGGTHFPPIGDLPYLLTLGPHAFYWFALEAPAGEPVRIEPGSVEPARLQVSGEWRAVLDEDGGSAWSEALATFLQGRRWYGGKARRLKSVSVADAVPVPTSGVEAVIALVRAEYTEGAPDRYVLPLAFGTGREVEHIGSEQIVARVTVRQNGRELDGVIYDASGSPDFAREVLMSIARRRTWKGRHGVISGMRTRNFGALAGDAADQLRPWVAPWEQSNTSIVFGEQLILKLFRRTDEGVNPDVEIGQFLTENALFPHSPGVAGHLEYRRPDREPFTLALLQQHVRNEGDAWRFTLDAIEQYFENVVAHDRAGKPLPVPAGSILDDAAAVPPAAFQEMAGTHPELMRLLGRRTGELHLALASGADDPQLAPEPFSTLYQRSLYQSMRNLTTRTFRTLREQIENLPAAVIDDARTLLDAEPVVLDAFKRVADRRIDALRIRTHGDYHLGQVLWTGRDFVIIDFEGEPARPVGERRIKRSPLADVAGMLRSFHYAVATVLGTRVLGGLVDESERTSIAPWADAWRRWISAAFVAGYLEITNGTSVIPRSRQDLELLIDVFLLEKAVYELGYELDNRPAWVWIPLQGLRDLLPARPAP
jgi:maltose alpha-D-glucosyltransferase / alpha-amylase